MLIEDLDLAVAVEPLPVRVVFTDGRAALASFFLHAASPRHFGRQGVGERLNEPHAHFLPLALGERVELVRVGSLAVVECPPDLPEVAELDELELFRAPAELELASGEVLRGDLRYGLPPGACRVSDLLNAPDARFLLLQTEGAVSFVNRDAVLRVRS